VACVALWQGVSHVLRHRAEACAVNCEAERQVPRISEDECPMKSRPVSCKSLRVAVFVSILVTLGGHAVAADLRVLFLGDKGHHQPRARFGQLQPVLAARGIRLVYSDTPADLNAETLSACDALLLYANIDRIEPDQAKALLGFVADGGGFVPLHCASYCFRNSDEVVALMGAQFERHGTGVFGTEIVERSHPVMQGFGGFESWDETYVHRLHNERNRTVLEYRVNGQEREPWTWVRRHGKGRVFYTAWGHDVRTWSNPGFQNLVERGIRWACGDDPAQAGPFQQQNYFDAPQMTRPRGDVQPFEYVDVGPKIPHYTPDARWGTQSEPLTQMQRLLPAEESLKHYVTPAGFELRLFADETQLDSKPIAMNWDERGRLWLCETVDYPNELAGANRGRDRIEIAEDTDGDGRADKFTLFAEGLSIPAAILPFDDSCIVQNGTETLFLADTDADGKADLRHVLISNWNLQDTHGGVSNFRLGVDNWIYAMQGYNDSQPVIDGKSQQAFRMGFWRFRLESDEVPRVAELEFLRSTNNNTWGLGISEEGLLFGSTANRVPSVYLPIANRYYERVRGWSPHVLESIADTHHFRPLSDKVRQVDHHGGYTAGCGHALYTARNYPQQWWNRTAFVCGPTGKLVGTFVLHRDGADFHSTSPINLVASDDEWAAPIAAEVGPDGNVWILDWYNYIVQHNPTPQGFETGKGSAYETDLRDKRHGRIYRLIYKNDAAGGDFAYKPAQLAGAGAEELVAALEHPTLIVRQHAQRLLVQRRHSDVVPALVALVRDRSTDAIGLNVGAIHAIWALHGLGQLEEAGAVLRALGSALEHPSAGVRRNALQALPRLPASVDGLLKSGVLRDEDAQVRLAAILALADQDEHPPAGQALAELASRPEYAGDRWIGDAMISAAAVHATSFLTSLADANHDADPLDARSLEIVAIVSEHLARGRIDTPAGLGLLATLTRADARFAETALNGLNRGWPGDHSPPLTAEQDGSLLQLFEKAPAETKGQLVRLGLRWGSRQLEQHAGEIVDMLSAKAADTTASTARRLDFARQLVEFQPDSDEVVSRILDQITPQSSPELSMGLLGVLSGSRATGLGERLVARTRTMSPAVRRAAIRVLLRRSASTGDLLDALDAGSIQLADLSLEQQRSLREHPNKSLRDRARTLFSRGGSLPNPDREKVLEELLSLTQRSGDARAGLSVFKKHCAKCHKHARLGENEGESIGPNLTGMAVHPKTELLTHIIDPSRSVEGNFRLYTVVTNDGRVVSGMLGSETRTSLELIDAEAKRHPIQREDIEELVASTKSVMPEGIEKQVSQDELSNLLEFLTQRGRYTPIDLRKYATIISTRGMFYDESAVVERLIFSDWSLKTFGDIPFQLVDPRGEQVANVVMLHGPLGKFPPKMPRSVTLPCHSPARQIHFLSGISGWGAKGERADVDERSVSMIVRLHYADRKHEDHPLYDGVHFADYIGRFDVPESTFAFALRNQQVRYFAIEPKSDAEIRELELIKGPDHTAPVVMAVTIEGR